MRKPFRLFKLILIFTVLLTSSVKPLLVDAQNSHSNSIATVCYHFSHLDHTSTSAHFAKLSKAFNNNDREKNDIVYFSPPMKKETLNSDSIRVQVVAIAIPPIVTLQSQVLRI